MIRWLRALFAWAPVMEGGAWLYEENEVTGARRVTRVVAGGHSPVDRDWLAGRPARPHVHPWGGSSVCPPSPPGKLR